VVGFWPANAVGDDIVVWTDEGRSEELARFHTLRQQIAKTNGKPNLALSDFIAETGPDYIGAFAVTAGHGELEKAANGSRPRATTIPPFSPPPWPTVWRRPSPNAMHKQVRTQLWGYAADEQTTVDDLIAEKYQGIRPAPGYPPSPITPRRPRCSVC
jgi:5-methyltetrahydrofolate--homocysteine methyltransferase